MRTNMTFRELRVHKMRMEYKRKLELERQERLRIPKGLEYKPMRIK